MASRDSNVVAFETPHGKPKEPQKRPEFRLIDGCRTIFSDRLLELLQNFSTRVDDELFKLSDKAENSALQSLYFESMRYMRIEKDNMQSQFLGIMGHTFDAFWRNPPAILPEKHAAPGLGEEDFSLIENEALEEGLAINTMIEKGNNFFHRELFGLCKRFEALAGLTDIPLECHPLSPFALCHGYEAVLKPKTLDLKAKLVIYKIFDRYVLSAFGPIYHEINGFLINEGVLPSIARPVKHHGNPTPSQELEDTLAGRPSAHRDEGEEMEQSTYLEAFHTMQSLMDGWRAQLGLPSHAANSQSGGVYVDPGDVLNALSILQHPALMPTTGGSAVTGEGMKIYVANQLGKLEANHEGRGLGRLEEDIIDMVSMVFDFILEDQNLPTSVKALIARLQIPLVKVAIIDKAFFAKKTHPARVLLNSLAQAGIGLDTTDCDVGNPVFKKIEEVVSKVLDGFDQNVELFSELLEDFSSFLEKETQRSSLFEERTRQATQSKEQIRLAKNAVIREIAQRMRGRHVPDQIGAFLINIWKDVLVLAYLRKDKDVDAWVRVLGVVDAVLRISSARPGDPILIGLDERLPRLLNGISQGLESVSFDPHRGSRVIQELAVLMRGGLGENETQRRTGSDARLDSNAKDPQLAGAILDIRTNLPDVEDVSMDEFGIEGSNLASNCNDVDDEARARALNLKVGEWIEIHEGQEKSLRAKLSWKSQVTALYVFVNRKGIKVREMSVAELAAKIREGAIQVIEGSSAPLMDRAMNALMQSLKSCLKPVAEPA